MTPQEREVLEKMVLFVGHVYGPEFNMKEELDDDMAAGALFLEPESVRAVYKARYDSNPNQYFEELSAVWVAHRYDQMVKYLQRAIEEGDL